MSKFIEKELMSTSTSFGTRPDWIIGHNDVDQQTAGTIHSSPTFNLFFFFGLIKANKASKFAEEPELTIKQYFKPSFF